MSDQPEGDSAALPAPSMAAGGVRIGCAGWTIPKQAAAAFPFDGSHLERYARVFNAVEINSSFYRPHQPKTYARWAASVPAGFRFSVKLPRTITHDARLAGIDAPLAQFASEVGALGDKLGCVLVQLPPKLQFDRDVAAAFFARLQGAFGCMLACEARHPSWFAGPATALLLERGITRVIADPAAGQPGPHVPTSAAIYARLHGSPRIYYSSYEPAYIAQLARDMAVHAEAGRPLWCIFDNTASGAAVPNALALADGLGMACERRWRETGNGGTGSRGNGIGPREGPAGAFTAVGEARSCAVAPPATARSKSAW